MALVAQKTQNGVIITDAKGCIEWVNEAFTRISGYVLCEVRGKNRGPYFKVQKQTR
ncbi:MAG: PAS domain S-box protein [Oscillatoriales cyanobacterium RU_3_3]|nr:PAS domain S-box protein [Oscillatoriales cyanobacterium RU_3_3]